MSTVIVDAGLGGIFRDLLIEEDYVVGVWPLSEIASTTARDIGHGYNPGTYTGTGLTRGVTVDLPEGALGCTFPGTAYVLVANDGLGFSLPGDSGSRNLSLAAGSMDVVCLLRTSTNDATLRAIVQKQETNSAGNGWHVGLQNGAIRFFLRVGGVTVFDFGRGSVADGAWHLVHCYYDPPAAFARILIDGVASGADVAASTEPTITTGDLRIGMFNDGAGGVIGTISYVMVGREGNLALSPALQATRAWTAITSDVQTRVMPIEHQTGDIGQRPDQRTSGAGTLTFALNNSAGNSGGLQGYYTIGHANCRSGWTIGTPIRLRTAAHVRFRGTVQSADPIASPYRGQYVSVRAADWMDVAAIAPINQVDTQVDQASHTVLSRVIDEADKAPAAIDFDADGDVFPFALDNAQAQAVVMQECARITISEGGYLCLRGDASTGGVLTYRSRQSVQTTVNIAATFDNTMRDVQVAIGADAVINVIRVTITPRRVDAGATTNLYTSTSRQAIQPGETVVIEGQYRDPAQEASQVGGKDLTPLASGTDYSMNAASDGTGTNLTAYASVTSDLGATGFRVEVTNTHATAVGYFLLSTVRGRGLYHYADLTLELRNERSVRRYGPHVLTIGQPYQSDIAAAKALAGMILAVFAEPRPIASAVLLVPNPSSALWDTAWALEPLDRVALGESMTGLHTGDTGLVTAVRTTIGPAPEQLTVLADVFPSFACWVIGETNFSEVGETTVWGWD